MGSHIDFLGSFFVQLSVLYFPAQQIPVASKALIFNMFPLFKEITDFYLFFLPYATILEVPSGASDTRMQVAFTSYVFFLFL